MENNGKSRISKSVKKDGIDKTVTVEEVQNGFIITIDKSWRDKKDCYQYECKKYISKENPFDKKESKNEEKIEKKSLSESLANFLENDNIEIDI